MATVEYFSKVIHELYITTGVTNWSNFTDRPTCGRLMPRAVPLHLPGRGEGEGCPVPCSSFQSRTTYVYESLSMFAVVMHNMNQ